MDDLRKQKRGNFATSGEPQTPPHAEPDVNAGSGPQEVNYLAIDPNSVADAIDLEQSGKEASSKREPEQRTYFWWFTLPYVCLWTLAVYTKNELIGNIATLLFMGVLLVWFVAKKNVKGLRDGPSMVLWSVVIACVSIFIMAPKTYRSSPASNSSSSGSYNSGETHQCGYCNTTFSGYGWMHISGEQYQQTSWSGAGYCSRKCAYESQPSRWK